MKKNNIKFILPIVIISIIAIGLTVGLIAASSMATIYSNNLENEYQKSFYDVVSGVNNIEIALSKIIVSTDSETRQVGLSETYLTATRVQSNLASLPMDDETVTKALSFVNTLSGYCYALRNELGSSDITSEELKDLNDFWTISKNVKTELENVVVKILGDYKIIDNIDFNNISNNYFANNFTTITEVIGDVPSLIFDGPFSDSLLNKEIKGLPETLVTEDIAREILNGTITKVYDISTIDYVDKTTGRFTTFNYDVTLTSGKEMLVQVCERGGFILLINEKDPMKATSDVAITDAEIFNIAREYCVGIGYDTVTPIYATDMGNYSFVNLVPKINDTYIYPDMIKVKVEKTSGTVCGFDAVSYAYNHQERTDLTATLGVTECSELLNDDFELFSTKLTLIPRPYGGEVLCYEFYGEWNNYEFYIYINANSGQQESILRVVSTSEGTLTI